MRVFAWHFGGSCREPELWKALGEAASVRILSAPKSIMFQFITICFCLNMARTVVYNDSFRHIIRAAGQYGIVDVHDARRSIVP